MYVLYAIFVSYIMVSFIFFCIHHTLVKVTTTTPLTGTGTFLFQIIILYRQVSSKQLTNNIHIS